MATPQYDRENTRRINLKLNNRTDADIIQHLESMKETEGIKTYIKALIRSDIMKGEKTMKTYGSEKTSLTLTQAARAVYIDSDPMTITEIELDDGTFRYNISGIIDFGNLTAEEVNAALEAFAEPETAPTLTGYNPAGRPVTVTLEDGHVMIQSGDETVQWNDEYYDEDQLYGTVRSSLIREGYSF